MELIDHLAVRIPIYLILLVMLCNDGAHCHLHFFDFTTEIDFVLH